MVNGKNSLPAISLLFSLFISSSAFTQETAAPKPKFKVHLSAGASLSHTGLPLLATAELSWNKFSLYLGPKISLFETYIAKNDPFGLNAGLKYSFLKPEEVRRWSFHVFGDYQVVGYKAFSNTGAPADRGSFVHEELFGYGLTFHASPRISITNELGIGVYQELFYNLDLNQRFEFSGFNSLVKIYLTYHFGKK